ncbi:MAG TPA: leucine-rich repeat domain-containing protein [Anaerolineaceae bacterium]|nr:leucine-rich repeat domain-containing protein [Anaerolineaceae bacterium]
MPKLERLYLDNNQLTGEIPAVLGNLCNLKTLSLSDNQLTGPIPWEISLLTNLEDLQISRNKLTGTLPIWLGDLPVLRILYLNSNLLTGSIPPDLGNLSYLWSLDLSQNKLSGTIPPELGNLANLLFLELAQNQLTGTLPPEFGNMTALTHLNLSHNLLEGTIPASFTNLIELCVDGQPEYRCYGVLTTDLGYNLFSVPQPDPPSSFLYQKDSDWHQTQGVKVVFPGEIGGVLVSNDGNTSVAVPPGAVEGELTLIFKSTPEVSGFKPPYFPASNHFELMAFNGNNETPQFNLPMTFTVKYNESDIGFLPEENLTLHYYDENAKQWRDAITTCPSGSYTRNPEQNQFSLPVCHLTDFALVGKGFTNYFPALLK